MSVTFATVSGATYYVMVDGNSGNQEAFDIIATTPNDAIVARPDANFNVNPSSGCVPLTSVFQPSAKPSQLPTRVRASRNCRQSKEKARCPF